MSETTNLPKIPLRVRLHLRLACALYRFRARRDLAARLREAEQRILGLLAQAEQREARMALLEASLREASMVAARYGAAHAERVQLRALIAQQIGGRRG